MAISYVGGQTAGRAGATSTQSVTFAFSGGSNSTPSAGDLVVVTVVVASQARNPSQTISTPTGYTNLTQLNPTTGTYDTSMVVAYKVMGSTPDTTVTMPSTGNIADAQRWTIQCFRGVDTTTPMDATPASASDGNVRAQPNPGAITPVTAGAWVVICGGGAAATGVAYTAPTNFTTNFLTGFTADTNDAQVGSGYWSGWTSGSVDPGVYGGGSTTTVDSWAAYTLALRPQAAVTHDTTGTLTGQIGSVAGSAQHNIPHGTSGDLAGSEAVIVGSADHTGGIVDHATTGTLIGQGSTVAGSAARFRAFASIGALTGQGSSIAGSASNFTPHSTSGALTGQGSAVAGAAARFRAFSSSGALTGAGALLDGTSDRTGAPIAHDTSGSLDGGAALLEAIAAREGLPPAPSPTPDRRHAGGRRGYIFKGKKYWLNNVELAQLIQEEQARIQDVQRLKRNKPKNISAETAKAIEAIIQSFNLPIEPEQPTIDNDDDEAIELLMML